LPGGLGPLNEPEGEPEVERYRLAVSRLRQADPDGQNWLSALAAWEVLRRMPTDADGAVVVEDHELIAVWEIKGETWARWRAMLVRSGFLLDAASGYYVNPLQKSTEAADNTSTDPSATAFDDLPPTDPTPTDPSPTDSPPTDE
jgi:hypothetical protein